MSRNVLSHALAGTSLFLLLACNAILGNKDRPLASDGSGGDLDGSGGDIDGSGGNSAGKSGSSQAGSAGKASRAGASSGGAGGDSADGAGDGAGAAAGVPSGGTSAAVGGSSAAGSAASGGGGKTGSGGSGGIGSPAAGSGGKPAGGAPGSGGSPTAGSGMGGGTNGGAGGSGGTSTGGVTVQLAAVHQTIQGFGLSDALLASTWTTTQLDNLFTTVGNDALGLSLLRIGMSSSGGLNGTTQSNLDGAKTRGAKIIGSCFSPPANCKSNATTLDGGHLNASCYDSWSTTIAKFADNNGLYAMSIANEPDFAACGSSEPCNGDYDSTLYTANELVDFVKVVAVKLQAKGVRLIAPEVAEWIHLWSNQSATGSVPGNKNSTDPLKCGFPPTASACTTGNGYDYGHWLAKDATAWAALDIIGVHEYDTQHAEPWPADVTVARKEVWQTEMSGIKWWPEQGSGTGSNLVGSDSIDNGVAVAGWIHSALVVGEASAWLWFSYAAHTTDDNEGLLLKGSSTLTKRYYALGNYSKFVRPGYQMLSVTGNTSTDLLLSAFKGTDGTVVVVAINKGAASATVPIGFSGGTAPVSFIPYQTSATDNLKAATTVSLTSGSFKAVLPSKTVTTFVGK